MNINSIAFNILSIVFSFQLNLFFDLIFENAFKESWNNGVLNFDTFIKAIFNSCDILVVLFSWNNKLLSNYYESFWNDNISIFTIK